MVGPSRAALADAGCSQDTVWALQDLTIRNDYYTEALDLLRTHQRFSNLRKLMVDVERTLAQRDDLGAGNQLKLASVIELTLLEWRFFTYNVSTVSEAVVRDSSSPESFE